MNKNKKITYKEIAKITGLSVGTISRYFNDYDISLKAKQKIKKVVDELGYVPNFAASTVKKSPNDVYLILPFNDQQNDNDLVISGVKSFLETINYNLFVNISSEQSEVFLKDLKNIINRNPKAIIIFLPMNPNEDLQDFVINLKNIPVMFYNPGIKTKLTNAIYIDSYHAFKELTELIYQTEHFNKINYLGIDDLDKTTGKQRRMGFENSKIPQNVKKTYLIKKNKFIDALPIIEKMLIDNPDVIICGTHTIALSVAKIMREKNLKQPILTDVSYEINFLNLSDASYTIFIDYFLIGYELARKIFQPDISIQKEYKIISKR